MDEKIWLEEVSDDTIGVVKMLTTSLEDVVVDKATGELLGEGVREGGSLDVGSSEDVVLSAGGLLELEVVDVGEGEGELVCMGVVKTCDVLLTTELSLVGVPT